MEHFGTQTKAAKAIGVSQPAISWLLRGKQGINPLNAIKAEEATGGAVTRCELRPDVFGPAPAHGLKNAG
ncbi:transcriptional regulator [Microbulbifer harenosus]|uniref:transcriptional regulator n=1 Tax=Microbulbifer harenosus TaxID=2576840 RepID=UPI003BA2DF83